MWGSLLATEYMKIVSSANEKLLQVHLAFKIMTGGRGREAPTSQVRTLCVFSRLLRLFLKLAQKLLIFWGWNRYTSLKYHQELAKSWNIFLAKRTEHTSTAERINNAKWRLPKHWQLTWHRSSLTNLLSPQDNFLLLEISSILFVY